MTFVIIFVGIYSLLNFYVLRRLAHLFKIRPGIGFYTLLVICTLSYIAAAVLDRVYANGFSRMIYLLASTWMGTGFLLFSCLIVYEVAAVLFKPKPVVSGIVICSVVAVLSLYATINAHRITVTNVDITAGVNMNIVQLSDIHLGSARPGFLEQIVEKTNSLDPDLVLITGDLMESHRSITPATLEPLNDLLAPAFFVTGNHDGYAGIDRTMQLIGTTKVTPLRNESVTAKGIQIIGIDDSYDKGRVARQLENIEVDPSRFSILMYHRPDAFDAACRAGIDLTLSGHTHNGQIFPFNYFVRLNYRHVKGLFERENCRLYVTSGTGTWGPRMRLGSNNEIVMLKLHSR